MLTRALLLVGVTIASLLALELLLRLVPIGDDVFRGRQMKWEFERGVKRHPNWGWGFAANVDFPSEDIRIKTVSIPGAPEYGMRDRGIDLSRPNVAAVLGDSFTFGADVDIDDIWCHRIERRHPDLEMLNLATGGGAAKAADEYAVLRDGLPPHGLVIYAMWLGNEFDDNAAARKPGTSTDGLRWRLRQRYERFRFALLAHSKLAALLDDALARLQTDPAARSDYVPESSGVPNERFGPFRMAPANPVLTRYAAPELTDAWILKGIRRTEAALQRLKDLAGPRRLLVILFPFKEQVHAGITLGLDPRLDLEQPNRIVLAICARLGIDCIDTLEVCRQHADEPLFWQGGVHFNPRGHAVVADETERQMALRGLLADR